MTKTLIAAGASLFVLVGAAGAIAQTGNTGATHKPMADMSRTSLVQKLDARFARLDANRDGTITRAELQQARATRHDARFAKLDADGNGALSRAEFDTPRAETGSQGHRHGGHGRWMGMKNGQITKADFEGRALARFDRMDADHNGIVTAAERQAAWSAMKARHGQPAA